MIALQLNKSTQTRLFSKIILRQMNKHNQILEGYWNLIFIRCIIQCYCSMCFQTLYKVHVQVTVISDLFDDFFCGCYSNVSKYVVALFSSTFLFNLINSKKCDMFIRNHAMLVVQTSSFHFLLVTVYLVLTDTYFIWCHVNIFGISPVPFSCHSSLSLYIFVHLFFAFQTTQFISSPNNSNLKLPVNLLIFLFLYYYDIMCLYSVCKKQSLPVTQHRLVPYLVHWCSPVH